MLCIIAGGHDIHRARSEELINQYWEALERVRKKEGTVIACGILSTMGRVREHYSSTVVKI